MKRLIFFLIFTCGIAAHGLAQTKLPIPRNIQQAYKKGTRSHDGSPGPNYWQNRADYAINVKFNPKTRLLSGSETITYHNNSPDTLKRIWFKLYPNLYKKGVPRDSHIKPSDLTNGVQISKFVVDGQAKNPDSLGIRGTNMVVKTSALQPGQQMKFNINFSYTINAKSQVRTGQIKPGADFIAYFYPRVAVYDDIDGWNRHPYTGSQEFYNDFCNFDVNITVPKNFLVWATGTLQNRSDVLADKYVQRLKKAETHDGITSIIDSTDLKKGGITAQDSANTWHYKAKNVTEFVFGTSNHYVWKSSSLVVDPQNGRRTRVDAVFNPDHKDYYDVIHFARKTVHAMSYKFPAWPYPYPHETIFDGLSQMEFPMMVNDNPLKNHAAEIELTDHEIFHTMFPFYMGTNETKYAWMDEGWATIGEWVITPMIDSAITDPYGMAPYDHAAGSEADLPIMILSTQQTGVAYYLNSYPKPGMGYLYVKDMLGDSLFTKALHHYITEWHGKHPMPYDFFYSMNEGAGRNMNWFWKRWFFDRGVPDQAIAKAGKQGDTYRVTVKNKGSKPVPVHLTVKYEDGSTQKFHQTMAVWKKSDETTISFKPKGKVKKLILGGLHDADVNHSDNVWPAGS